MYTLRRTGPTNEPSKAAALYEQALHIQERIADLDAHDRQARFDLAARCGTG